MALSATIFKIELSVSDIDHGYYEDHSLTVARHPSETDERMVVRLLAFALRAHRLAQVDGTLDFGPGLSTPDTPDLQLTDYSGLVLDWIDVGQPDEKALAKASKRADTVQLFPFSTGVDSWWKVVGPRVSSLTNLVVQQVPAAAVRELAASVDRRMNVQVTVLDGELTVSIGEHAPISSACVTLLPTG